MSDGITDMMRDQENQDDFVKRHIKKINEIKEAIRERQKRLDKLKNKYSQLSEKQKTILDVQIETLKWVLK